MKIKYSEELRRETEKIKTKIIWFAKFYLVLLVIVASISFIEHYLKWYGQVGQKPYPVIKVLYWERITKSEV